MIRSLTNNKWHSMPLIDEQEKVERELTYFKRGTTILADKESPQPPRPGPNQARSLEDMLRAPSSFPALVLPTAVVRRSKLCISEAEVPTRVVVKSNGIELQEVTLRSLDRRSLGINIEIITRTNGKSVSHEVYIKQIHQKGNAYLDGRLKIGDRIIKVNDLIVGKTDLVENCQKHVWTLTIARRVEKEKVKSRFSCAVVPKGRLTRDLRNEDDQQMLCSRFLEGLDKKKVFKEVKRATKKHIWERVSKTSMEFEAMLTRSHDYLNVAGRNAKVDVNKDASSPDEHSRQFQMFYPQQELFLVRPTSELNQHIPSSNTSDIS